MAGVVALSAGMVLALAGCGGDGEKASDSKSSPAKSASSNGSTGTQSGDESSPTPEATATLAQVKGGKNITVTINTATRDAGGFVTVTGTLTNGGTANYNAFDFQGTEVATRTSGPSVAGATLVDEAGKKRYYVLRDTDGKCLCTMGLTLIKPGETRPIFAQFPAPPESTTRVQFQLPTMPPASIEISDSEG
jgi:hypothetical protein